MKNKSQMHMEVGQLVRLNPNNSNVFLSYRRVMLERVDYDDETQWADMDISTIGIVISTKLNSEQRKECGYQPNAVFVVLMGEDLVYIERDHLLPLEEE